MSVEFQSEVEKIAEIIGRYTGTRVKSDNYRVRISESSLERYVRVEFHTNLHAADTFTVDLEKLSNSVHKFVSEEYYTLAYIAPYARTTYKGRQNGSLYETEQLSFVVKFFVD